MWNPLHIIGPETYYNISPRGGLTCSHCIRRIILYYYLADGRRSYEVHETHNHLHRSSGGGGVVRASVNRNRRVWNIRVCVFAVTTRTRRYSDGTPGGGVGGSGGSVRHRDPAARDVRVYRVKPDVYTGTHTHTHTRIVYTSRIVHVCVYNIYSGV